MTKEEIAAQEAKKAEEEAKAKAETETEATDDQTPEEIAEAKAKVKSEEESKQLEAQLQKEKDAGDAKDKIIADQAFKLREKQRKDDIVDDPDEEPEKGMTRTEVQAMMDSQNKANKSNEIDEIVSLMSDNDKERELIKLTHKNRTYPAHLSMKEQLKEAYLVANKGKIVGENQELKRALSGKKNASTDASATHQDSPKGGEPKFAKPADKAELARQGWKWNGTTKRHEKEMNGGTLVRHKDGKTEFIKG